MVNGSIFGDRTLVIAIATGIVGIGLISAFTTKSQEKIITSTKRWLA